MAEPSGPAIGGLGQFRDLPERSERQVASQCAKQLAQLNKKGRFAGA